LPERVLEAVRGGSVSSWAAVRVFAPLARANADHAQRLLASVRHEALSTRDLHLWFAHYQRAQRREREHMADHPRLLLDSVRERSGPLHISPNTVRRLLREPARAARGSAPEPALQQRLKDVYARAQGNAVRMAQILRDEDGQVPPYSTLTRWVREAELREPP